MTEREQFLGDVITTAVEAGYEWWLVTQYQYESFETTYVPHVAVTCNPVTVASVGERVGEGARAVLHVLNDDETDYKDEDLVLDYAAVERGLARIAEGDGIVSDGLREFIVAASEANDATNVDAGIADVIVQAALLGEVVYG